MQGFSTACYLRAAVNSINKRALAVGKKLQKNKKEYVTLVYFRNVEKKNLDYIVKKKKVEEGFQSLQCLVKK